MYTSTVVNLNDGYETILRDIKEHGDIQVSRGLEFLELSPYLIEITDPLDNMITNKDRKWSHRVAKAEYDWYMSGSNLLKDIVKDMPIWERFSDDGIHIRSAYGYRWKDQIPDIKRKLYRDLYTRKAVISLYDGIEDIGYSGKDTVCTLSIQFIYRDDKLNMHVNMRSNDLIWGFCNDAFSFSELLKEIADDLSLKVGSYFHHACSIHLYDTHYYLLDTV
jgi:thymidylate synthase